MKLIDQIIAEHHISGAERHEMRMGDFPGLKPPDWINDGPVYEVFLRRCPPDNNFRSLQKRIPDLKQLGIKTIWLMPIHPIGEKDRKGKLGSPYAVKDFFGINPAYGSARDFKALVCEIHHYGLKIIIDLVANHGAKDHVMFENHPDMFKQVRSQLAAGWTDIQEFNYKNSETRDYMMQVMEFWVREFDIDGYRCDSAGLIPADFWEKATELLTGLKADILMLAEWESGALHQNAFHASYDWTLYAILDDICQMRRPVADIIRLIEEKKNHFPQHSMPMRFTENHDFPRTPDKFGTTRFYPYAALMFMIYGIPLLYAGQEYGAQVSPSLFEEEPEEQSDQNAKIFAFYRRLIQLRRENAALRSRSLNLPQMNVHDRVLALEKIAAGETVLVLLNFSDEMVPVTLPDLYDGFDCLNLKTGNQSQPSAELHLDPHGIWMIRKQSTGVI